MSNTTGMFSSVKDLSSTADRLSPGEFPLTVPESAGRKLAKNGLQDTEWMLLQAATSGWCAYASVSAALADTREFGSVGLFNSEHHHPIVSLACLCSLPFHVVRTVTTRYSLSLKYSVPHVYYVNVLAWAARHQFTCIYFRPRTHVAGPSPILLTTRTLMANFPQGSA